MAWAPDYTSTSVLKSYLRISDAVDDPEMALAITAASRSIDHVTNRQFGVVGSAEARTYELCWSRRRGRYVADVDDFMTQTGLVVTVSGDTTTDFALLPLNAAQKGRPWEQLTVTSGTPPTDGVGPYTIDVTALWGWTAIPETIANGALVQAARFFKRRDAPFGVAGSPDIGSEVRLLAKADPDVEVMVRPYRRDWPFL